MQVLTGLTGCCGDGCRVKRARLEMGCSMREMGFKLALHYMTLH